MKKILCALLACAVCATTAAGLAGCGCSKKPSANGNNQQPGYVVEPTEPDLKDGDFGFFIINSEELMVSKYYGSKKNVEIPETYNNYKITVIGDGIFNDDRVIESVTMPDSIKEIKDYAFSSCPNLSSVKFSQNLKVLGHCVFFNTRNLKTIELPDSLEQLGTRTFSATGIESITIPKNDKLTSIDDFVFYQCQNLKEVTIPGTVTNIKDNAFGECPNKITLKAPTGSYTESYAKKNSLGFQAND